MSRRSLKREKERDMSRSTRGASSLQALVVRFSFSSSRSRRIHRFHGFSSLYLALGMLMLLGFVSLAVDLGRVRTTKAQLMTAADAASLAAVPDLPLQVFDAADDDAIKIGQENSAIHNGVAEGPVNFDPDTDIIFGYWRPHAAGVAPDQRFIPIGKSLNGHKIAKSDANAVQTFARRVASRGNSVRLFFGGIVGKPNIDVTAEAIAFVGGGDLNNFGFVGIDWMSFNGTTGTDSYNGSKGNYGGGNIHKGGSIASNGSITLVGTTDIRGDARPGTDDFVDQNGNVTVTGWTAPLDYTLKYPVDSCPSSYSMPASDDNVTNSSVPIPNNKKLTVNNGDKIRFNNGGGTGRFSHAGLIVKNGGSLTIYGQLGKNIRQYKGVATVMGTELYLIGGGNVLSMNGGVITIDATAGPVTVYVSNNVSLTGNSSIAIVSPNHYPVRIFCNGTTWDTGGCQITNPTQDATVLYIDMTAANSNIVIST
jgi:hypothetical protein